MTQYQEGGRITVKTNTGAVITGELESGGGCLSIHLNNYQNIIVTLPGGNLGKSIEEVLLYETPHACADPKVLVVRDTRTDQKYIRIDETPDRWYNDTECYSTKELCSNRHLVAWAVAP